MLSKIRPSSLFDGLLKSIAQWAYSRVIMYSHFGSYVIRRSVIRNDYLPERGIEPGSDDPKVGGTAIRYAWNHTKKRRSNQRSPIRTTDFLRRMAGEWVARPMM